MTRWLPPTIAAVLLGPAGCVPALRAQEAPPFQRVAKLRALGAEAPLGQRPAVRVRGVVTFVISHPEQQRTAVTNFTLQDESGGIWANVEWARREQVWRGDETRLGALKEGAEVEILGELAASGLAPNLLPVSLRVLGQKTLPPARAVPLERLMSGAEIAQRVSVSGVIQRAELYKGRWWLRMETPVGHLFVEAANEVPLDSAALVDAEVQVEGLAASVFNSRRDFARPRLRISDAKNVRVTQVPPADPFASEKVSIASLAEFSPEGRTLHRRRIEGTVTHYEPGSVLYVQEGLRAVRVGTSSFAPLEVGDRVEASGFIDAAGTVAGLSGALFRKLGTGAPLAALPTTLGEVRRASAPLKNGQLPTVPEFDGLLVSVTGRVLSVQGSTPGGPLRLVLDCAGSETTASLAGNRPAALQNTALVPGSVVRATGVAMLGYASSDLVAEFSAPTRIDLLLREPADIAVLQAAPWWTVRRALSALAAGLTVALAALGWSIALRRTVRAQTAVISDQLSRATLLQERSRMARELHDTVEQELMGLSLQLDAAGDMLPDSPATAQRALQMGRALLQHTRAEVRRSIWDLRVPEFEQRDLAGALRETLGALASAGGPQVCVEVHGVARRLQGSLEVHLLRIATEAVTNALKHAQARRILAALHFEPESLRLRISDDGRGFDRASAMKLAGAHFGLLGMNERAQRIGGSLEMRTAPGMGTEIFVHLPTPPAGPPP